ncbi:hypothetical protein M758_6G140300 [Ceratodon purpureus]|nr:hypothetical protein M758_6G140300 [Ceratodon purpureus]
MKTVLYPNILGVVAVVYIGIDYLREVDSDLHKVLRPLLSGVLAVVAIARAPYYDYWTQELSSIGIFIKSLLFMLSCLCIEAIMMQYVTVVLGLDWHWNTPPLPDSGQWLFLFLNEKFPKSIVSFLQAPFVGLHHFLMLFLLLAFSVLYGCVKAPGMELGARYMFTMGVGRLIRILTFTTTILPSPRPWCAHIRFKTVHHPHPWAQKYHMPYSKDPYMIREIIDQDKAFASIENYPPEYVPNWGLLQFMVNILRPIQFGSKQENWFNTLKRAGGGCNDLVFSGHMYVAVLTAMAWQEAYAGWTSVFIWCLVAHSGQREIRERHHYSVDVVVGIYTGILVWLAVRWIWPLKDSQKKLEINQLIAMQDTIEKAANEGDLEKIKSMLCKAHKSDVKENKLDWVTMFCGGFVLLMTLGLGLLAFIWTADG